MATRATRERGVQPNPYVMAVMTAALAGLFSVICGYFVAGFQARNTLAQKQYEYRASAYGAFLDKADRYSALAISQVLHIGAMAEHLATDSEIQEFENHSGELLSEHDGLDLYLKLNADLNLLRLHGSDRVSGICSDILKALTLQDDQIDWSLYPQDVVVLHDQWKAAQDNGIAYGWEERVSGDERLMIVTIAKLTQVLVQQLRLELRITRSGGTSNLAPRYHKRHGA